MSGIGLLPALSDSVPSKLICSWLVRSFSRNFENPTGYCAIPVWSNCPKSGYTVSHSCCSHLLAVRPKPGCRLCNGLSLLSQWQQMMATHCQWTLHILSPLAVSVLAPISHNVTPVIVMAPAQAGGPSQSQPVSKAISPQAQDQGGHGRPGSPCCWLMLRLFN